MANASITVTDTDLRRGIQALERLKGRLVNLKPANAEIGEYMLLATRERFDRERAPDGSAWTPLSRAYATRKARSRGNLQGILKKSGLLRDTILYRATAVDVRFGTNLKYGAIHQFGGDIQRQASRRTLNFKVDKKTGRSRFARKSRANFQQDVEVGSYTISLPARPYLGVSASDRREILAIMSRYLAP